MSKCLFDVFNFPKKRTKTSRPEVRQYHSSKVEFFRSFFGGLRILKSSFEINWPLASKTQYYSNLYLECVFFNILGWILTQKIVELIFGPNLHVEVIKQCHVLLNFLAVEGKITNEHINVIWQAAQLKHCSKQVHDLLLPLIKNLEAGPVLHLYDLMKELPVKGMNTNLDLNQGYENNSDWKKISDSLVLGFYVLYWNRHYTSAICC